MTGKLKILIILLLVLTALNGCGMIHIDQLYCLPKKAEKYASLQSAMDTFIGSADFSAPVSGAHQQVVQSADLDGDGISEFLVFTKEQEDRPLRIYIFKVSEQECSLLDCIQFSASDFDQVAYVDMDGNGGCEIIVGCTLESKMLSFVSVYSLRSGCLEKKLSTVYSEFLTTDLNGDGSRELLVLKPAETGAEYGIAELFSLATVNEVVAQSISLTRSTQQPLRIIGGNTIDGKNAVYISSATAEGCITTDVLFLSNGQLDKLTVTSESSVNENAEYFLEDLNGDGIPEIPTLISMRLPEGIAAGESQHLVRWFSVASDGTQADQLYTYHNLAGGWYLRLDSAIADDICVVQQGSSYEFGIWKEDGTQRQTLFTIYALTGQKREEQAVANNRFVLHRTSSTVYAAKLEVASAAYGMSRDSMVNSFHRILPDWGRGGR